jgi:hypothetical protein
MKINLFYYFQNKIILKIFYKIDFLKEINLYIINEVIIILF